MKVAGRWSDARRCGICGMVSWVLAVVSPAIAETRSVTARAEGKSSVGIEARSENGKAVVKYNGKEVWSGEVKGQLTTKASSINGEEYAAAFDDDRVLWESCEGAAAKLGKGGVGLDLPNGGKPAGKSSGHKSSKSHAASSKAAKGGTPP